MVDIGFFYDYYMIIIDKKIFSLFEIVEVINIVKKFWLVLFILEMFGGKVKFVIFEREFDFEKNNIGVVVYKDWKFIKFEIVLCVLEYYEKIFEYYKYNLFENNCEYFVIYCVIGEMISL